MAKKIFPKPNAIVNAIVDLGWCPDVSQLLAPVAGQKPTGSLPVEGHTVVPANTRGTVIRLEPESNYAKTYRGSWRVRFDNGVEGIVFASELDVQKSQ